MKLKHTINSIIVTNPIGLYLFTILITLFSCSNIESSKNNANITFENKTHNFEKIPQKEEVSTTFIFSNTGEEPLLIQDVKTTCGCTVPQWTKEMIRPNDKGEIKVAYDAKYPGRFNKTISVYYNGKNSPQELTIKGQVAYPEEDENTKK